MNTWNIDYPDSSRCEISSEGRSPDHTISCSTGETADSNARYHGARAMHLALVTLDATADRWAGRGEDFRELIVPSAIKATHKNHIRTFVRRALQSATGDMLGMLRRGRELTGGASVRFLSGAKMEVSDGQKMLRYTCARRALFGDSFDHQFLMDRLTDAETHFVLPDAASAYRAHKAATLAKFRHAACDHVINLVTEARGQFAEWEPAG